jgi:hypothetical protein
MLVGMKPQRTESFEHTIRGLLTKRRDLLGEAERLQERLAAIKNDIIAIDRVLRSLGHTGEPGMVMPRQTRGRLFLRNELSRLIADVIRRAEAPISSRAIASQIVTERGEDAGDRKYLEDMTKRVSRSLYNLRCQGRVKGMRGAKGHMTWERRC